MKVISILIFQLLLMITNSFAHAKPLILTDLPAESLGNYTHYFIEDGARLPLSEAVRENNQQRYRQGTQPVFNFGIGSRPAWLHLQLHNPTTDALQFRLTVGTTWIDHLDVAVLHNNKQIGEWQVGDAQPVTKELIPAKGFAFNQAFPPGNSDIYIRAETNDPLILPITLTSIDTVATSDQWSQYGYGFMYGYLCALIAYNLMLYAGLRKRSYLYYLLYLSSFILVNLAYTGHGYAWLWSTNTAIQRYIILVLMVLYGCCGLVFACRFLTLNKYAPRLLRWVQGFMILGACLMGLAVLLNNHLLAVLVAFGFLALFTLLMVVLGSLAIWQKRTVGGYFFSAAFFGMLGTATTTMAVLGWIPFTPLTFHSVDLGILIEATLLALALTRQVREQQNARIRAEYLARHDSLTGALNRRGFHDIAHNIWSTAVRKDRPFTLIMLDIDHFKLINDEFGHTTGDKVLADIALLLTSECRTGDIVVRWGGEEFLLCLPETGLKQASMLAERIRLLIEAMKINAKHSTITTTVSIGIAERLGEQELSELIYKADTRLYTAKEMGRNQISSD